MATGKPVHWEGGKLFPCPYIFVTVFLIDEVWYVIWLVVTAGSMGVIEMKCDSLSLSGASRLAATLRCISSLPSHVVLLVSGPGMEVVGAETLDLGWCCSAASLHQFHVLGCCSGF